MPAKKTTKTHSPKTSTKSRRAKSPSTTSQSVVESSVTNQSKVQAPAFSLPTLRLNPKVLTSVLILIGVGLLTYKLGPWLVPAVVDKTPITRFELYKKLDQAYGAQVLDDMINEKVLKLAIAKSGIKVEQAKVDEEIKKIEAQFESMGGLDDALSSRGITRADLISQVNTQLAVEELLKDKIEPTEEEIKSYFDQNKTTIFKDKKLDDVKADIQASLRQNKLREAFMTWFEDVKKEVSVKNFSLVEK